MLWQEGFIKIENSQENINLGALSHSPEDDIGPKTGMIHGIDIHEEDEDAQSEQGQLVIVDRLKGIPSSS